MGNIIGSQWFLFIHTINHILKTETVKDEEVWDNDCPSPVGHVDWQEAERRQQELLRKGKNCFQI